MNVTLDGMVYEAVDDTSYTIAYDLYMTTVLQEAGLTGILARLDEQADETQRLLLATEAMQALASSGKAGALLAGLLTPVGTPWTPESAAEVATRLGGPMPPPDRATRMEVLVDGIAGFFGVGPRSSLTSP